MRTIVSVLVITALSACALPGVVQRQSVEYNTAAAGMANQLALLNIVRAEQHLPIFYTSISRLSGSVSVTASGGFNAAMKDASPVDTGSTSTATAENTVAATSSTVTGGANAGTTIGTVTTSGPTVTKLIQQAVTHGGDVYTPSIGGQVVSGPSFDINILDTQQFYQGVLLELPFSTVELFINQDVDNQLLMRLFIERIEFRLHEKIDDDHPAGYLDHALYNVPSDTDQEAGSDTEYKKRSYLTPDNDGPATKFIKFISCVELTGESHTDAPKALAPVSRVTQYDDDAKAISIRDLALLDGNKLDIAKKVGKTFDTDGSISDNPTADKDIFIIRTATDKRLPRLVKLKNCIRAETLSGQRIVANSSRSPAAISPAPPRSDDTPASPAPASGGAKAEELNEFSIDREPLNFDGVGVSSLRSAGTATFSTRDASGTFKNVKMDIQVYFRSPEGVIRYLGKYLEEAKKWSDEIYKLNTGHDDWLGPLFSVKEGRGRSALVTAEVSGTSYSIDSDANRFTNMTVMALLEELVDLQKSATDRPVTVPVHVLQ
jgi:hypothetical protein